eukprot:UN21256
MSNFLFQFRIVNIPEYPSFNCFVSETSLLLEPNKLRLSFFAVHQVDLHQNVLFFDVHFPRLLFILSSTFLILS